jgi:hypothetical protein
MQASDVVIMTSINPAASKSVITWRDPFAKSNTGARTQHCCRAAPAYWVFMWAPHKVSIRISWCCYFSFVAVHRGTGAGLALAVGLLFVAMALTLAVRAHTRRAALLRRMHELTGREER